MMKFSEIKAAGYEYPEIIPASLRGTIDDWFDNREVVDDDNFARYFNRVLNRDYHRYNELLRIEAGTGLDVTAGFDWLVNSYMERENIVDTTGNITRNATVEMDGTISDEYAPGVEVYEEVSGEDKFGKTETLQHGATNTTTYGRRDQTDISSDDVSGTGTSGNATSTAKAAPASVLGTYGDGTESDAEIGAHSLEVDVTLGKVSCWDSELSSPSAISKAVNNQTSKSAATHSGQNINQASGNDVSAMSGSDVTTHGGKNEVARTTITTKLGTDDNTKTYDTTETTHGSEESAGKNVTHEIYTGRSGENMASALEKAKYYIQSTSAWDWLQHQLEPCFMAIYDV